jgi:hypothetical protein
MTSKFHSRTKINEGQHTGRRLRVNGTWSVERGAWSVERGAWGVERRAWSVGRGASSVERGAWDVERGAWSVGRRAWSVERGGSLHGLPSPTLHDSRALDTAFQSLAEAGQHLTNPFG